MENLKRAGAFIPHIALLTRMEALQRLMILAKVLEERGGRAAMVTSDAITVIGAGADSASEFATTGGRVTDAATCYGALTTLKGHEADEYAVTREELKALNARAQAEIETSDELAAFSATLAKLGLPGAASAQATQPTVPAASAAAADGVKADKAEKNDTDKPPALPDLPASQTRGRRATETPTADASSA
ncbi:hypothetical protein [Deinococcus pimensis]|uniref:hypothetical protein n=1 Tax=Deinococcus pimensis TaxID=309888 RepID=UPI0004898A8A|nr:hypothetical protein [Deinococcus pimensis]